MKKVLLIAAMLVLVLVLVACADAPTTTVGGTTGDATTTTPTGTTATVVKEELDVDPVLNTEKWTINTDINTSAFEYFGSSSDVANRVSAKYMEYTREWYLSEDGKTEKISYTDVKKLDTIGAMVEEVDSTKVKITVTEVKTIVQPAWTSVTARAGSYLMFEFTTNLPMDFYMTVTKQEGGSVSTAAYKQDGVTVKKVANGTYKGTAKCTVPYAKGQTFYINICTNKGKDVVSSIPVTITPAKYDSVYSLMFQGDWELIRDPNYLPNLIDLFYNVYPRLYARFAFGSEPKQITFMADKDYDGVAYCAGTTVCVSVDYANSNPNDLGFFSHEITHSVQQYSQLNYGDDGKNGFKAWWTENMANYGGFRYFHWGYSTQFVQVFDVHANEESIWNWGYQAYGNNKVFFAYMDWKYPTLDNNKDGKITPDEYGLIDAINYMIKNSKVKLYDTPNDPTTTFNKKVAEVTDGKFDCIEALRKQFEQDCRNKEWDFTGFRDYPDNFRTENLPGIPNPTYPTKETVKPTAKTHDKLTTPVTTGTNLFQGAKIKYTSAKGMNSYVINNILDGDLTTRLQDKRNDGLYKLTSLNNEIIIDLGAVKNFDTYTFYNASSGSTMKESYNTKEWEILISNDGSNFTAVDYQKDNNDGIVSVNIGDQSARYIKIRVFNAGTGGVLRFYEVQLYKVD